MLTVPPLLECLNESFNASIIGLFYILWKKAAGQFSLRLVIGYTFTAKPPLPARCIGAGAFFQIFFMIALTHRKSPFLKDEFIVKELRSNKVPTFKLLSFHSDSRNGERLCNALNIKRSSYSIVLNLLMCQVRFNK